MSTLVDTSLWPFSLRRKPEDLSRREIAIIAELSELVKEGNVCMIGPVRQELCRASRRRIRMRNGEQN